MQDYMLNPPDDNEPEFWQLDEFYEDKLDDDEKAEIDAIKDEDERYAKLRKLFLEYWKSYAEDERGEEPPGEVREGWHFPPEQKWQPWQ